MSNVAATTRRVWKSARLLVGFHRDRGGQAARQAACLVAEERQRHDPPRSG